MCDFFTLEIVKFPSFYAKLLLIQRYSQIPFTFHPAFIPPQFA